MEAGLEAGGWSRGGFRGWSRGWRLVQRLKADSEVAVQRLEAGLETRGWSRGWRLDQRVDEALSFLLLLFLCWSGVGPLKR